MVSITPRIERKSNMFLGWEHVGGGDELRGWAEVGRRGGGQSKTVIGEPSIVVQ